jgi:hypothetical protein
MMAEEYFATLRIADHFFVNYLSIVVIAESLSYEINNAWVSWGGLGTLIKEGLEVGRWEIRAPCDWLFRKKSLK